MDNQENPQPMSTVSSYWLSEAEQSTLLDKANKCDMDAAYRLAKYHSFIDFDCDKKRYWLERAASVGHVVAQYNLAFFLFNKEGPDTTAALYWAEMAKGHGEEKAQVLIDEIRSALNK